MKNMRLSGSQYPINDLDNLLDAYEHIGEEMYARALTFIGVIHGFLHRLQLRPIEKEGKTVYYPSLTPLKLGESVDVATEKGSQILVG
ncbi:MAG: hypothetical protein SVR94_17960 [Pseudomonadota bacterium]|nr:hypothetical protein [Pseudomonadota bacterium]